MSSEILAATSYAYSAGDLTMAVRNGAVVTDTLLPRLHDTIVIHDS